MGTAHTSVFMILRNNCDTQYSRELFW